MVVDSDVLIDFFRDVEKAKLFLLESSERLLVSRLSVMEVILGVKSKRAGIKALKQLENLGIEIVEVDGRVSEEAGKIFWDNSHKWGIGIIDSFVAETTMNLGAKLAT